MSHEAPMLLIPRLEACSQGLTPPPGNFVVFFLSPYKHVEGPAKHWFWSEAVNTGLNVLHSANWPCEVGSYPAPTPDFPSTPLRHQPGWEHLAIPQRDVGTCSEEKNASYLKCPNFPFSQLRPAALPVGSHRSPGCHLEVRAAAKHRKCFSWRPDVTDKFELLGPASWEDGRSYRGDSRWCNRSCRFTTALWGWRASSSVPTAEQDNSWRSAETATSGGWCIQDLRSSWNILYFCLFPFLTLKVSAHN